MLIISTIPTYAGFGAIAFSPVSGSIGHSEQYPSRQGAETRAKACEGVY